jgi:hypothetical protein
MGGGGELAAPRPPVRHPFAGLLHFSRGAPGGDAGVEELSAYRRLDQEVVGFANGGRLVWRVGDQTTKCTTNGTASPIGTPSAVAVTSYVWMYTWPNGQPIQPLQPLPQAYMSYTCAADACVPLADESGPFWNADCDGQCTAPPPSPSPGPLPVVGCSSGQCDAFCGTPTVHGCVATWPGTASMRDPPTGKPCGGSSGPCAVPADACAPGWAPCLTNDTAGGSISPAGFRSAITADACAAGDPRRFISAMSHAIPAWSNLPPGPCPTAPQDGDNGCAADGWGAEPVCCGASCQVPSCPNDIWVGGTRIHVGEGEGCGAVSGGWADGVLCCRGH